MLHIHRAERADGLIDALRALLADPLPDPFAPELVAVPTRGMERWLTQRMSDRLGARPGRADGVCANVGFPPPRAVVTAAIATASGVDPETDPWLPERMVWPLLEVIDDALEEPWLHRLAAHLGGSRERARRFGAARHLADLFDGYALHRPELVARLDRGQRRRLAGRAVAPPARTDRRARPGGAARACVRAAARRAGHRRPAAAALRLRPDAAPHGPSARVPRAGGSPRRAPLPAAPLAGPVGAHRHRSTTSRSSAARPTRPRPSRPTACWRPGPTTPGRCSSSSRGRSTRTTTIPSRRRTAGTLLARIQADVRADRGPLPPHGAAAPGDRRSQRAGARLPRPRPAGRGPARRDPAPARRRPDARAARRDRDVPRHRDLRPAHPRHLRGRRGRRRGRRARRAPAGAAPARPARAPRRPVAAPDQPGAGRGRPRCSSSPTSASPPRSCSTSPTARPSAAASGSTTTTWPGSPSGRARPGSAGGSTPRIAPRSSSRTLAAGTWKRGLDRVLLGVTMTEEDRRLFGNVLPLDDVESGAIDLAGRFAEFVDRLGATVAALRSRAADRRLGGRDRGRGRRPDRDPALRRVAARRAAARSSAMS